MRRKYTIMLIVLLASAELIQSNIALELFTFLKACYKSPAEVGALAPCSSFVADSMAAYITPGMNCLEIGSGTGTLTGTLAQAVGPQGRVDAVELDSSLCEIAKQNLKGYKQVHIHAKSILDFKSPVTYDVIVCTLPFNSLPYAFTHQFFTYIFDNYQASNPKFMYVEYALLGSLKKSFVSGEAYQDFVHAQSYLADLRDRYMIHKDLIYFNAPPINVYHLQL